jgi:hypothetical protein
MITTNTDYYYISNRVFYKLNLIEVKKGKKTISKNGKESQTQDLYKFKVIKNDLNKQLLSNVHIYQNNINEVFETLEKAKNNLISKLETELERVKNIQEF